MRELPAALAPMGAYRQFIVYFSRPSPTRPGKIDKFPVDFRTGRVPLKGGGGAHDPEIWTDSATACSVAAQLGAEYGVGFVFTDNDPFFFVDLDDALLPDGSGWRPHAVEICKLLSGAAVEVSVSGRGLHIFGVGRPPAHRCESAFGIGGLYHNLRYAALTGNGMVGNASTDCSAVLPLLVSTYWAPEQNAASDEDWSDGPCEDWRGPKDDEELVRRALRSSSANSAFGARASFADLWTCNVPALAAAYPDPSKDHGYNDSQADSALAQHLAFWTGRDCERIERLMRASGLVRDKWERDDYLPRTIRGVVARQHDVLSDKAPEPLAGAAEGVLPSCTAEPLRPTLVTGSTYCSTPEQFNLFAGAVYVRDTHRVLIPGGTMIKPDQFRVHFGGYTFTMDPGNEKTSRDPWEAFTQSQSYRAPRADGSCFRPDLPPGSLVKRNGQTFVNTYWPVEVERRPGDASPFFEHLTKILPDETDRAILLYYMAACVQHQGVKFQWAPLLQGVEGNGKTLFTRCVAHAVGHRYVHMPKASKISAQFNAWMVGKVFYGVEDIYVPEQKREVIEDLKPMITGDNLEIEGKGVDQISADICGNFILNSNHKDGVRKTKNDRRFSPLFCAQQQVEDLLRDGMGGDYFPRLYNWLKDEGYAVVAELLHTLPIPDQYNPAFGGRAPRTTSTDEAIAASLGAVEQEVQEAIEQGLPGFCGGWISSIQLERLLERIGKARFLPHNKRRDMLGQLGYVYHPALAEGRVNNLVLPDGGKPRLFVRKDGPLWPISTAAEAAKAYELANNHARVPFPVMP